MRIPSGVWGWTGTALVVLVVALPPLVTLRLDPGSQSLTEAAGVVGLVVNAVALAAALVLYFHWRLTTTNGSAWLTAALTAGAVKGLAMAGMRVAYPDQLADHAAVHDGIDLVFALTILAHGDRRPPQGAAHRPGRSRHRARACSWPESASRLCRPTSRCSR